MTNKNDKLDLASNDLTTVDIINTTTNEIIMSTAEMLNIDLDEKLKETVTNEITTLVSGLGHLYESSQELSSNGTNSNVLEEFEDIKFKMRDYVLYIIEEKIEELSIHDLELFKLLCANTIFRYELDKLIKSKK